MLAVRMSAACLSALLSVLLSASGSRAGVPSEFSAEGGKWIVVDDNWSIDTEDVERNGDILRFWVRRRATGNEQSSTQGMTEWTGKIRVRCGDFHARTEAGFVNGYGMRVYVPGPWERIDRAQFAYALAANFCYLTGAPGYTPELSTSAWQQKISDLLKGTASPSGPSVSSVKNPNSARAGSASGHCLGGARERFTTNSDC